MRGHTGSYEEAKQQWRSSRHRKVSKAQWGRTEGEDEWAGRGEWLASDESSQEKLLPVEG